DGWPAVDNWLARLDAAGAGDLNDLARLEHFVTRKFDSAGGGAEESVTIARLDADGKRYLASAIRDRLGTPNGNEDRPARFGAAVAKSHQWRELLKLLLAAPRTTIDRAGPAIVAAMRNQRLLSVWQDDEIDEDGQRAVFKAYLDDRRELPPPLVELLVQE